MTTINQDDHLIDTNILVRFAYPADPDHAMIQAAIVRLTQRGGWLCYSTQNMLESWNVLTRPATARGGFGLTPTQADVAVQGFEAGLNLLTETEAVYQEWRRIVVAHSVSGVQVYDARLAAFMRVYNVPKILTMNAKDFTRYGVTPIHPANV